MKIVLITQAFYPAMTPRANRTIELAEEFARRGHRVTVYALTSNFDYKGYTNRTGVVVRNLGVSRFGLEDSKGDAKNNIFIRLLRRLFGRLFLFPDFELIPMVRRAIIKENEIDLLVSISVPHVIPYAIATIENRGNIKKWIADSGDPFMFNPFVNRPFWFSSFEKKWCSSCDYISVPIESAVSAYYPEYRDKIKVIPQGLCFNSIVLSPYIKNDVPTFAYAGNVYNRLREPTRFLEYLSLLNIDFKFIVYTKSPEPFLRFSERLKNKLVILDYIERSQLLTMLSKMDFLINIANNSSSQSPSKIIDYALTKRPILTISSGFGEKEQEVFRAFLNADYSQRLLVDIDKYDIVNVANQFELLSYECS